MRTKLPTSGITFPPFSYMCAYSPLPGVSQVYCTCLQAFYLHAKMQLCNPLLQGLFTPLSARPFPTYTYAEKLRGTLSTQIQISYLDKAMTEYSEALLLFANLQFMRKAQYSVTCKYGHNHKNCLTFIIKDKHLANCDTEPLILQRSYKG